MAWLACCVVQQTLETELRTLRAAAEELVTKFDESVLALATARIAVLRQVLTLELKLLGLATSLQARRGFLWHEQKKMCKGCHVGLCALMPGQGSVCGWAGCILSFARHL